MNFKLTQVLLATFHLCELVSGKPISSQLFLQPQVSKAFNNVANIWQTALRLGGIGMRELSNDEYFSTLQKQANEHDDHDDYDEQTNFLKNDLTTTIGFPLISDHDWIKDDYNFLKDYETDFLPTIKAGISNDKFVSKSFERAYEMQKKKVNDQVKRALELKLQLDKRVVGMYPDIVYGRRDSIINKEKASFEFRVDYSDSIYEQGEFQSWKQVEDMLNFKEFSKMVNNKNDDDEQVSALFDETYQYDPPTAFMKILTCGPVSGLKYGFKAGEYTGKGINSLVRYAGKEGLIEPIAVMSAGGLLGAASGAAIAVPVSLVVGTIKSAFICMDSELGNGTAFFVGLAITTSVTLGPVAGGFAGAVAGFRMCTPENLPKDYYNVLVHRIQQRSKAKFKHILSRAFGTREDKKTNNKKENREIGNRFATILDKIPSLPFDFPYLFATFEESVEGRDESLCTGDILRIPLTKDEHVEREIKVFSSLKNKELGFESIEVAIPMTKSVYDDDDDVDDNNVAITSESVETLYWQYTWKRLSTGEEESLILKYDYVTSDTSVESPSLLSLNFGNDSDIIPLHMVGIDAMRVNFDENEIVDISKLNLDYECLEKKHTFKFDWNHQVIS